MMFEVRPTTGRPDVLELVGELDLATAGLVEAGVERLVGTGLRFVALDLSGVSFCDSTGLATFVSLHKRLTAAGGRLRLAAPSERVTRLFNLVGLDEVLNIYPTVAETPDGNDPPGPEPGEGPPAAG